MIVSSIYHDCDQVHLQTLGNTFLVGLTAQRSSLSFTREGKSNGQGDMMNVTTGPPTCHLVLWPSPSPSSPSCPTQNPLFVSCKLYKAQAQGFYIFTWHTSIRKTASSVFSVTLVINWFNRSTTSCSLTLSSPIGWSYHNHNQLDSVSFLLMIYLNLSLFEEQTCFSVLFATHGYSS